MILYSSSEEPAETNVWVQFRVFPSFKHLHWKGFHSDIAEVKFIVYPKKTMQRVVEVTRWTLRNHLHNFTIHGGRGRKVSCVPTMKAIVLLTFNSWLSPVQIFIPYWTVKHSVDYKFEMNHLGLKASHQASEGLPKDGMNNRAFCWPLLMKSYCQPIFSSSLV